MAKSVVINGVTYSDVPKVEIPLADGEGEAIFIDTDSGDVKATDIRSGKKGWAQGVEVTGTVVERNNTSVSVVGKSVTVPAGIYDNEVSVSVTDATVTPNAAVTGSEIGNTQSAYPITITPKASVDTTGYVESVADGAAITKYIQVEEKTITPTMSVQSVTPTSGKLLNKVTVNAVELKGNATAADVMAGKTFYNTDMEIKTGTATVPTVSQDKTTKVLEIV